MRVAVLMPAYAEGERLCATLATLAARAEGLGGVRVFVVDDGSAPPVDAAALPPTTPAFAIVLARHVLNLGQGAALETARQLALARGPFEVYVTMDADGQHSADDIAALVAAIDGGADVAFGNRFAGASNVPLARQVLLRCARVFERWLTGLALSDAHNGFRAFSHRGLAHLSLRQDRMAHATEITQQVARGARAAASPLSVVEVPVSVRYTRERLVHGQPSLGAVAIVRDLFHRYLFFEEPE